MPVHLSLLDRASGTAFDSLKLIEVDEWLCQELGKPVDPVHFVDNWMDTVGFSLAINGDYAKAREHFPEKTAIIDLLEKRFATNSYSTR